jgi:GPH family glycoside/pentoside/hexuronide:cation symporter
MNQPRKSTLGEKFAWGAGGMSESLVNSLYQLAFPIFSIGMGVAPALMGLAQSVPRLVDAFTDPLMGNISDNARTRWGRRRPFILCGALLMAVTFPLVFLASREWSGSVLALWFGGTAILFFLAFTIWSIPWSALGLELSADYNDRTRLQVMRMIFATVGSLAVAWVYKACFWFDADEVVGARSVAWIVGGIMLSAGILSALFVREWRYKDKSQPALRLLPALKLTLTNRPFLWLCGTVLFFAGGIIMVDPMLLYVNIYHVYGGERDAAATMMGISSTTAIILAAVTLPLGAWFSEKAGKRRAALLALALIVGGKGLQFWFVTPDMPYLQLVSRCIFQPGIMMMWALVPSMIADVCDLDEVRSGRRREASFSSVYQWIWKLGATLAMTLGGVLLSLAGAQTTTAGAEMPPETILRLRLLMSIVPALFGCMAAICILCYPNTRGNPAASRDNEEG